MITRIARKEMTEMFRDGRFRWASAIVLALITVGLGVWVLRSASGRSATSRPARTPA